MEQTIADPAAGADASRAFFWVFMWLVFWGGALWLVFRGAKKPELAPRYKKWAWGLVATAVALTLVSVGLLVIGLWQALESPTLTLAERETLIAGGWQAAMLTGLLSFVMLVFAPLASAVGLTIVARRVRRVQESLRQATVPRP